MRTEYRVTVDSNGSTRWRNLEGELHRECGPAIEYVSGERHWYLNGRFHREDGPACEYVSGVKYWYIHGKQFTEEEFNNRHVTEMTIEEVCNELGKNVIIVEEK